MSDPWKERRWGRFRISLTMLEEAPEQVIGLVFGSMRITRAATVVYDQSVRYEAVSPLFDPVPENYSCPWYELKLSEERDGAGNPVGYTLSVEKTDRVIGRGL